MSREALKQWKERIDMENSPELILRLVDEASHDLDLTDREFKKLCEYIKGKI